MKKLIHKVFQGWSADENMVDFINENNIQQSDILKITYFNGLHLFYYIEQ